MGLEKRLHGVQQLSCTMVMSFKTTSQEQPAALLSCPACFCRQPCFSGQECAFKQGYKVLCKAEDASGRSFIESRARTEVYSHFVVAAGTFGAFFGGGAAGAAAPRHQSVSLHANVATIIR